MLFRSYNQRAETRTVSLTTLKGTVFGLTLAPLRPGLLVQDAAGNLLQVEAQGSVTRDGQQLLSITGHTFVIALDGKDLTASQQLLIAPVPGDEWTPPYEDSKGSLSFAGLAGKRIELGELQYGTWQRLEGLQVQSGALAFDEEQARNLILATAPDQFEAAGERLKAFTRFEF